MILDFWTKDQLQNLSNSDLQSQSKSTKCVWFKIKITNHEKCFKSRFEILWFQIIPITVHGTLQNRKSQKHIALGNQVFSVHFWTVQ